MRLNKVIIFREHFGWLLRLLLALLLFDLNLEVENLGRSHDLSIDHSVVVVNKVKRSAPVHFVLVLTLLVVSL